MLVSLLQKSLFACSFNVGFYIIISSNTLIYILQVMDDSFGNAF
jgi:hypothetical protein